MKINIIRKHWMNVLASVMLAGMFACSGNELEQASNAYDPKEPGRSVDLITQTIETDTVGGLETALKAAMGEEVGTLQKLVIKGPISGTDWGYVRSLTELVEIDMTDMRIVGEGSFEYVFNGVSKNEMSFVADTICNYMFSEYGASWAGVFNKLEKVLLPSTIKHIGYRAFYDCIALKEIEIPSSVKVIEKRVFEDCVALDSVILNEGLAIIEEYAFEQSDLKSIELPASLTSLGGYAFSNCKSLASVTFLGNQLSAIGTHAFYECSALTSVDLPENLEVIGGGAFTRCTSLSSVTFPESLKVVEGFSYCSSLESITLPNNLESIPDRAFEYCSSLKEITIPQSVTSIGSYAFRECTSLKTAKVLADISTIPSYMFDNCGALETVELSSTITKLKNQAFRWCRSLSDPAVFANIKETEEYALEGCGFETFNCSNMTVLANYLFKDCLNLKSVKFPDGITVIPRGFFEICPSMTTFEVPATVTTIGEYAFNGSGLVSIDIPSSVTSIGNYTFQSSQIGELTIPETVTSVGSYFVNNCENLIAVYWNSPIEVPYNNGTKTCFLYLANDQISYNRNSWKNVIMDGVAESIVLNEDYVYQRRASKYAVPKKFLAKKISYTRRFDDTTYPGRSSGWQTLTLPFTPTSITHPSKGVIAPFNSEVEDAKPFWLRELTSEGFVDVTTIEPNKPYIIAMPNHGDYLDEYRLNGDITFSADSVYIDVTPDELTVSVGPNFELHPCYAKTAKSAGVYSLNVDTSVSGHDYGSVFVRSLDDVYTFEAYVTTLGGGRSSRSLFGTDTHSKATRAAHQRNTTGIPQIGDM